MKPQAIAIPMSDLDILTESIGNTLPFIWEDGVLDIPSI